MRLLARPGGTIGKYGLDGSARQSRGRCPEPPIGNGGGVWADYYDHTNYSDEAREEKARLVAEILAEAAPRTVWDLGANTGRYSQAAAAAGRTRSPSTTTRQPSNGTTASASSARRQRILPLVLDLSNPSGGIGWANRERSALSWTGGPPDVALALALIHHLAIGNNVPFERIAEFLAQAGPRRS